MKNNSTGLADGLACPNCGKPIQASTSFCSHCNAAILRRYCPGCNKLVPAATRVCPYCSTPANAVPKERRSVPRAAGVAAAILAAGVAFFLLRQSTPPAGPAKAAAPPPAAAPHVAPPSTPQQARPQQAAPVPPPATAAAPEPQPPKEATQTGGAAPDSAPGRVEEGIQLNLQAHALMSEKRYEEAIPLLRRSVELQRGTDSTEYAFALYNLGRSLRMSGRAKEAVPILEECTKIIPNRAMAEQELARARQLVGTAPSDTP